jgi:hypothetical protein
VTDTFESTLMCGGVHGLVHYAATYIDWTAPGLPLMSIVGLTQVCLAFTTTQQSVGLLICEEGDVTQGILQK